MHERSKWISIESQSTRRNSARKVLAMKKYSPYHYRRAVPRRFRKPLTRREVRAFMSAADREPLALDLKCITMMTEELE
jgi:integrase